MGTIFRKGMDKEKGKWNVGKELEDNRIMYVYENYKSKHHYTYKYTTILCQLKNNKRKKPTKLK